MTRGLCALELGVGRSRISVSCGGGAQGNAPPTGAIFQDPGGALGFGAQLGSERGLPPRLRTGFRGTGTGGQGGSDGGREVGEPRPPGKNLVVSGSPQHSSGSFLLACCFNLKRSPSSF